MPNGPRFFADANSRPHRGGASYRDAVGPMRHGNLHQCDAAQVDTCRACGGSLEFELADLGLMPLANRFLTVEEANEPEPQFPLRIRVCRSCFLAQHDVDILPEFLYHDYVYYSSFSEAWVNHARRYVELTSERCGLDENSLVLEIGSNDGYLLQHFVARGVPVLGVEPAQNLAVAARARGVTTEARFFGAAFAGELQARGVVADLIVANNVLTHVPMINDFLDGVRRILKPNGVFTAEFPHLLRLIENAAFDTFYHEHFFYVSLLALEPVLARSGLRIFDVEELAPHGGSLHIYAGRGDSAAHPDGVLLSRLQTAEIQAGLLDSATYTGFSQAIRRVRQSLNAFLTEARTERKSVVGFGAAEGVLLNYCNIGRNDVEFVVDETPAKVGKFLPGSCCIPVVPIERIQERRPDYVLILPWNHKEEIIRKLNYIRNWDGAFLVGYRLLALSARNQCILPSSRYGKAS
jgi:SAM-dependent methyltransferase